MVRWNAILPCVLLTCGLIIGCPEQKPKETTAPTQQPPEKPVVLEPTPATPAAPAVEPTPAPTEPAVASETTGNGKTLPKQNYAKKPAAKSRTYTVKAGDSLQSISKKYYNDSKKWRTIYDANRRSIKDPNKLPVGKKLIIP